MSKQEGADFGADSLTGADSGFKTSSDADSGAEMGSILNSGAGAKASVAQIHNSSYINGKDHLFDPTWTGSGISCTSTET